MNFICPHCNVNYKSMSSYYRCPCHKLLSTSDKKRKIEFQNSIQYIKPIEPNSTESDQNMNEIDSIEGFYF